MVESIVTALPHFLLVFCRIAGFFLVVPIFAARNAVPTTFRIGLAAYVSFTIVFALPDVPQMAFDSTYVLRIVRETVLGIVLGFVAYLFFVSIQLAGSFIDLQMGFGIANVIDPMSGAPSPLFGGFKYMVAMLLFLSLNAHHYLIRAVLDSFALVPLDHPLFGAWASGHVTSVLFTQLGTIFMLAFQMAAPLVVAMFLIDVALGILAKTAPQFNIFVIGIPLKIGVGFVVTLLLIPGFIGLFESLFATMFEAMYTLLQHVRSS